MQLQISLIERKPGKEKPESSKLEFLEKFSANDFALSDAEDNTSELLNSGGIADLPLLKTLLSICQKSQGPSLRETEVKPVENISKILQSFLQIRPMQKEAFFFHKLGAHAYEY